MTTRKSGAKTFSHDDFFSLAQSKPRPLLTAHPVNCAGRVDASTLFCPPILLPTSSLSPRRRLPCLLSTITLLLRLSPTLQKVAIPLFALPRRPIVSPSRHYEIATTIRVPLELIPLSLSAQLPHGRRSYWQRGLSIQSNVVILSPSHN